MNMIIKTLLASSAIFLCANNTAFAYEACATPEQTAAVSDIYKTIPGAPPLIAARRLNLDELKVLDGMQGLFPEVHGIKLTPELTREIYSTIENWGADSEIHMIFSMGGSHVADIPSNVPVRQPDDGSGFIDIYADDGDGVHGHIFLDFVKYAYAAKVPREDGDTRMISFYDENGKMVSGFYASLAGKPFDQDAVNGWDKTYTRLKSIPSLCG